MPVWKYKRLEDMPESWEMNRDIPLGQRIRAVLRLGGLQEPLRIPRGVRKYRSIEEANADRDRWEQERVDRLIAHRRRQK